VVHICIPALGRLRWEDCEFKTSLGYTVSLCLKKTTKNNKKTTAQTRILNWE
jgi:hypothetical protein